MTDEAGAVDAVRAPMAARVVDSGPHSLAVRIAVGGLDFPGDEPIAAGGTATGPAPHDLLCAALAECTALTLRLYADQKRWPLEAIQVEVGHAREKDQSPADLFRRTVRLVGPLDAAQRARLLEIAERCPVHRTLTNGSRITTREIVA